MTPEKMIVIADTVPSGWRASKYVDSKTRLGKYQLNHKATIKKLKKSASIDDMKVDFIKDDDSHSIQFSTGSYLTTVVPFLESLKVFLATDDLDTMYGKDGNGMEVKVVDIEEKTDSDTCGAL